MVMTGRCRYRVAGQPNRSFGGQTTDANAVLEWRYMFRHARRGFDHSLELGGTSCFLLAVENSVEPSFHGFQPLKAG
jgi:hypothetical protein